MWLLGVFASFAIAVAGYQLRYKKRYWLIAGYDRRRTKNAEPLAQMLGGIMLVGGACLAVNAVGRHTAQAWPSWIAPTIAVGMVAAVVIGGVILNHRSKLG